MHHPFWQKKTHPISVLKERQKIKEVEFISDCEKQKECCDLVFALGGKKQPIFLKNKSIC
jgi:hypothetical protein